MSPGRKIFTINSNNNKIKAKKKKKREIKFKITLVFLFFLKMNIKTCSTSNTAKLQNNFYFQFSASDTYFFNFSI